MARALPVSRRLVLLGAAASALPTAAQTNVPVEVQAELKDARLQGSGRFRFLGLSIYDARLWVQPGFAASAFSAHAFALELEYQRALVGKLIAERSLDEMKKVGTVSADQATRWLAAMTQTFPDVKQGDRLTSIHREGVARFFLNGQPIGDVRDADFARLFFGIWLSPRTSDPALRRALVGA